MIENIIIPKYNNNGIFLRQIRSFVLRNKKINDSGIKIIKNIFPILGLSFKTEKIDLNKIFDSISPIVLEIGFGTGKTLVDTALKNSKKNFLGIEVHQNSFLKCLKYAFFKKTKNLKVIYHDAEEVMLYMIKNRTLSTVQLFFPDPWHKKRHHKRRILKKKFINLILKKLVIGGTLHVATDCQSYADDIIEIINHIPEYKNLSETNNYIIRPKSRPVTKFEKKAIVLNKVIFDLFFEKIR
ncbi:tRNA (guanosine(46)-N7)-methyltransferase TrmB [Buchnera aphidicola]|uniref:tRNA (guanosine(46)-N7)-methyltransferase TrmB n=1 Tax=Buchnera aphidicola TaxID=9 RepID=UPI003464D81D